jgi:transposase InsO family protein
VVDAQRALRRAQALEGDVRLRSGTKGTAAYQTLEDGVAGDVVSARRRGGSIRALLAEGTFSPLVVETVVADLLRRRVATLESAASS